MEGMINADVKLYMMCLPGPMWVIGRKEKVAGDWYLVRPSLFVHAAQGYAIMSFPGLTSEKNNDIKIPLANALFPAYIIESQAIEDSYIEHTTGIKPLRAPLAMPPKGGGGPRPH